jgi:ABC-type Fe3+/spermidine/putrescine transport system ATPase subunit
MAKDLELTAIHVTHDQSEAMAISDKIAVMKKGRIVQTGTPNELYMNPNSIFVAYFIGETNFLEGYVSSAGRNEMTIELHGDVRVQTKGNSAKPGERVILAIRPEVFAVERGTEKGKNSVSGAIERITFEGTTIRYEVRLANEDLIFLIKPSMTQEWFGMSETVTVSFPTEKVHVFKYPEAGLKEEIAVE